MPFLLLFNIRFWNYASHCNWLYLAFHGSNPTVWALFTSLDFVYHNCHGMSKSM